jgi:hypothetical protein
MRKPKRAAAQQRRHCPEGARDGRMKPRKLIGTALVHLLLTALAIRYVAGIRQEDWGLAWSVAFIVGVCAAMSLALYDRSNFPEKSWDFDPRRGVQYFLAGLILFPILIGVDAISGADIAWSRLAVGSLAMSTLVGIAGMFTENVGV